jgi:autotransporter-associated beta strand protein
MRHFHLTPMLAVLLLVGCGGGGGSTKPDPEPTVTCSQRLGTGIFVTTTVNNPAVSDSTCPAGSSLTTAGSSYTTTTTTYSCPNPNSNTNPVAATNTSAPIVTQTKVCTVTPVLTCAQKDGQGAFVDSTTTETITDNTCPTGQFVVQSGQSSTTTTTTYSCADPSSTADPVASIITGSPVPRQPKVCNLNAPINYSTYFRDKTGVNNVSYTGQGVKVVVHDEAFNLNHITLHGKVSTTFGAIIDNEVSHGTSVASILAGSAVGQYPGGIAPNVTLALSDWDTSLLPAVSWGGQVFNFSFGYDIETAGATPSQVSRYVNPWLDELRAIKSAGGIVVISAGNEGLDANDQPLAQSAQILAGASAFYPELDNILAVVAMSPLNGTKALYSNPCGAVTMNFCLSAPGTVNLLLPSVNFGDPITADSYYSFDGSPGFVGTSTAAPIVSGIAALVYQAFSGINGSQVREVLLTTATDLGSLGVDPVYGWGYVNAEKAVLGPAVLRTTFTAAVPDGATWNFGNDISGDGDLIKVGGGGLSLTGNNTYAGPTRIDSGILNLSGSLGSDVFMNGGAFNAYGGIVNGNVHADAGTLGLAAGSTLQINGMLDLNGAGLTLLAPSGYTSQWQGTVLTAAAINGSAESSMDSSWFSSTASVQDARIDASIQRRAVTDVLESYSATQLNSATNLEAAFAQLDRGAGTDALRQSAAALQSTDTGRAAAAILALSGQSQTTMKDVVLETGDALQPLLNERLRDIERVDGERGGAWFMFASPDSRKRETGFLDTDINSTLWAAGADWRWQDVSIGAALFTADDRVQYGGVSDQVRGDRTGIALYARQQGETWYWQGYALYSQFDSRTTRTLDTGLNDTLAESRSEGDSRGLSIETGRKFGEHFGLALLASADWAELDAYAETGSTGLELGFPAASLSRVLLGPDLRYGRALKNGFAWDVQAGYRFVLNDVGTGMRAYYTGLPGTGFTVDGMPYPDGFLSWGLGLGYRRGESHWYLRGNGQDSGNADRFTVSAGVRIGF